MKKLTVFLILILGLAALLRLTFLNNVPNSITYDQIYYVLNAKSFLAMGTDLSGAINPLQLFFFHYPQLGLVQSELPFFLQFPLLRFLPMSLAVVTFPNALISILTVFIFYLLAKKLFDTKTALYVSLVAAINPWFIFIGRTFYEMVPATFFYVSGLYVLLVAKKWKILWAFPLFLLAFYSYIGTKLIFFPFILLAVLYCYFSINKKQYGKQYLSLILLSLLTIVFFLFQLTSQPNSSRLGEIITPNNPAIVAQVDAVRKQSVQNPLTHMFENKMTVYSDVVINNFLNIFSPSYLFAHGDTFFSMYTHGLFYMIDAVFLLIGAFWLFAHNKKLFIFFVANIVLSTVPQITHDPQAGGNFTPHITLLFPFFILLIGAGISKTTDFKNKPLRVSTIFLIGFVYTLSVFNFLNIYFYQYPLQTGIFDFSSRVLSRYITLAKKDNRVITVYSTTAEIAFKKYLFYSNSYTNHNARTLNDLLQKGNFVSENVTFRGCPTITEKTNKSALLIIDENCGKIPVGKNDLLIAQLKDSGGTYKIINDKTCTNYSLGEYIAWLKLEDLNIEKLSTKDFCEAFIIH